MVMVKKYPEWAPKTLIDILEVLRDNIDLLTNEFQSKLVESWMNQSTNIEECSEDQKREYRARNYDMFLLFPFKEQMQILEKLLTDTEMEAAWNSLRKVEKVKKDDSEYQYFWHACVDAIAGGRRAYQRSKTAHKEHFQKIKESALSLTKLLEETNEMYSYESTKLISNERIERLCMDLGAPPGKNMQHVRSHLDGVIPSIHAILYNISIKAEEISKDEPLVKKPNSGKAAIHYFIRYLSGYLRSQYGEPLDRVVAITVGVIFDNPEIDKDHVRKLAKK